MVFDVTYQAQDSAPSSGLPWGEAFLWLNARVNGGATEVRVTNQDGSITLFTGTGLTLDASSGVPTAGDVTQVQRLSADENTLYEQYTFNSFSPPLAAFYGPGISDWFLTGNDSINGGALNDTLIGGDGEDELTGGQGDLMVGGAGNDKYAIVSGTPTVVEDANGGTLDLVEVRNNVASFVLPANVENLSHVFFAGNFKGTGNALDNQLLGGVDKDTLIGLGGADTLDGRAGIDTLIGGKDNDTYFIQDVGDKIIELKGQGINSVNAKLNVYTLPDNVENLAADSGVVGGVSFKGNSRSNVIFGALDADTLRGLGGNDAIHGDADGGQNQADTMLGGTGNDTYYVDNAGDIAKELRKQGTDTVVSQTANVTLSANVENLIFEDLVAGATGIGNKLNNKMTAGNSGADLSGLGGNDTLVGNASAFSMLRGGVGNDTYVVNNAGDTTIEVTGQGTDRALLNYHSSSAYVLIDFVENGAIIDGIAGETRALTGNGLKNILTGSISNDTLDGSAGKDTMAGGKGDDIYVVDVASDIVKELAGQGHDKIKTALASYTLGLNIEDLEFTDGGVHTGTGNNLNNIITSTALVGSADTLKGLGGNDTLSGGEGDDILIGGKGDDTYIIKQVSDPNDTTTELANEGNDTILTDITIAFSFVDLADANYANIENLVALPTVGGSDFRGNELNNLLIGGMSADTLTGREGNDTLNGNADGMVDLLRGNDGNDTYIVDELIENIEELTGEGTDTIKTSLATLTLTAGPTQEFENLTYTGNSDFTGTGNSFNNVMTGGDHDDQLNGMLGADTLIGGKGNDTYVVDNAGDQVIEKLNEGTDTIETSLATFTLGANVENLTYSPFVPAAFTGTGNALNNGIIGGIMADILTGLDGDDRLDGGASVDTFIGGKGNDTYVVDALSEVTSGITELANQGIDTIEISATGGIALTANVENMTYTGSSAWMGISGNELNNVITGGDFGNQIFGGFGNDTLIGGNGADELHGDNNNDTLFGGADNDQLFGDDGNDILDGGLGDDTMEGGQGNDLYKVDSLGDTVGDFGGGIDTIEVTANGDLVTPYTTPTSIEIIKFTGSGDFFVEAGAGSEQIIGGNGNDHFESGSGTTLVGGKGDDTYVIESNFETISEKAGEGKDTVEIGSFASYTLGANIENLTHTALNPLIATGNALDNVITGSNGNPETLSGLDGNDRLISSGGFDTLIGGKGDDVYIEASEKCTIVELASQGNDTLATARQNITNDALADNVENLFYTGVGNIHAIGNGLNNIIVGGSSDGDILEGKGGNDTLFGGLGNDFFRYIGTGNGADIVQDFTGLGLGGGDLIEFHSSGITDFNNDTFIDGADVLAGYASQQEDGVKITIDANNSILLLGYKLTDLQANDFFVGP